MVLGHSVIVLPFAVLVILPRLRSLDPAMNEAAQDLGASPFASLRLITLPLLAPALMSSGIICFVTSFDEFAIASFLAPSGQPTYPVFLYASARTPALLPEVIAIGALIIAGSLLLVAIAEGVVELLAPVQERYAELRPDEAALDAILSGGAERARAIAAPVVAEVRDRMGIGPPR